ncbi:HD-GYP domain-containing protein [Methylobacterium tarhaniae]|uniref:HD-GYP domain-containing protein n=1 Tax=Methylobacterium tarhaniae TaxID=1187852 RepID=UPI003D0930DA
MSRILLISDNPRRSRALARDLAAGQACEIHDLYDDASTGPADAFVTDLFDFSSDAVTRVRNILERSRRGAPLVMVLHHDCARARLFGMALGASHTLCAPLDLDCLRDFLGLSRREPEPMTADALNRSEEARRFYGTVFVPDQPITSQVIDAGTDYIGQAIRDTGIRAWVRAVQRFDDATHQHCLLVTGLAAAFAGSRGLGPLDRHRLTKAALLHDVGKICVPHAILNKPGRLDAAEMAVIRQHPEQGWRLLADQGFEPEMLAVVRSHHEMLDGSGYPDRLRGEDIPDLVRLVTVCDIYAALIERRSYKAPMSSADALAILDGMGERLDTTIVRAFRPIAAAFTPDA